MANIFDTAKYILEKSGSMSTMKLQKLCYYSQAWSLVWDDSPLFEEDLLKSVLVRYGSLSSWKLSSLSHEEFSWKKSRVGLETGEDGNVELSLGAMKVDATKELVARKANMA